MRRHIYIQFIRLRTFGQGIQYLLRSCSEELAVQQFHRKSESRCRNPHLTKAHGLNIYGYLKYLLKHRSGKNMTDEQLAKLAFWSEKLQSIKNRV